MPVRFRASSLKGLAAAAAAMTIAVAIPKNASGGAAASVVERTAIADAYVSSYKRSSNFGIARVLRHRASNPKVVSYIKFDITRLENPISRATLKFYAKTGSSIGVQVRNAAGDWAERKITYANAPGYMDVVQASSGAFSSNSWVSVDVTTAVTSTSNANLALLTTSGSYLDLSSREVSARAPRLVLETQEVPPQEVQPVAPVSPGTSYFVDSITGSDSNDGASEASPWQSLAKAASAPLAPGDSLLLKRGGAWTGALNMSRAGTEASPIRVRAYGEGALPVIQGGPSCVSLTGSYLVVSEIQARACSWAGVEIKGSNNRVESSTMADNVAGVSIASGAAKNAIVGNQMTNNNKMSVLTASPANDDSGAFGVLINGDDNEVAYNVISGSDAFSYDYGRDGAAVEIYGGQRNNIHHNKAYENDTFAELGGSRTSDNVLAYNLVRSALDNSLFFVTRGANDTFGPVLRTSLHNNSVALSGAQSQGFVCYAGCSAEILRMRNNIVQAVWKVGYADAAFDEGFDIFYGGQMQFERSSTSTVADPQWVDASTGDLHLKSTSPAVDRGEELGFTKDLDGLAVPLDGNRDGVAAADRGAFELK